MRLIKRADTVRGLFFAILMVSLPAGGAELSDVEVSLEEGRYKLTSRTQFAATKAQLFSILTNYDLYTRFTSSFAEAKNLEPDEDGRPRFYTRLEGCVLLFCRSFIRYGHLELNGDHDIVAIVDPELSSFKYSRERWQLFPHGDGTIMLYEFEMEPDFWVPPIVGPYFIKKSLAESGDTAVTRIEALALGKEPKKVGD